MAEKEEKRFWLIEIWQEKREVFKTLIEHPLFFSIPIISIIVFDYIFKISGLSDDKKHILELIDFYGIVACLGILTISFIIKLVLLTLKEIKDGGENQSENLKNGGNDESTD